MQPKSRQVFIISLWCGEKKPISTKNLEAYGRLLQAKAIDKKSCLATVPANSLPYQAQRAKPPFLFGGCSPGFTLTLTEQTAQKRCLVSFCWLSFLLLFFPLRTISAKTISLWQSEFVILSNHLGCLQNFSRWQPFVDKCFVIQVISFSATVAILINWTYDCICQDWIYCHSIWHLLLSKPTRTSIVFIEEERLCACTC